MTPHRWPLPDEPFVPGKTKRPSHSPAFEAAAEAPRHTREEAWQENDSYLFALRLHNAGFFWEGHEVMEAVWLGAVPNSEARFHCQAIIQLSNAALKQRMDRQAAALRLLELSRGHWRELRSEVVMGIRIDAALSVLYDFESALRKGEPIKVPILNLKMQDNS